LLSQTAIPADAHRLAGRSSRSTTSDQPYAADDIDRTLTDFTQFRRQASMAKKKDDKAAKGDMKFQPLGDRVVVEREEGEKVTAGGIVLPDTAKDKPTRGKVISVGDGRMLKEGKRVPLQVKVGDRVLFSAYAGDAFKLRDRELLLMREEDILAVLG
jgi:chaperonin GroES